MQITKERARAFITEECERLALVAFQHSVLVIEAFLDGDVASEIQHREKASIAILRRRNLVAVREQVIPKLLHDTSTELDTAMTHALLPMNVFKIAEQVAESVIEILDAWRRWRWLSGEGSEPDPVAIAAELRDPTSIEKLAECARQNFRGSGFQLYPEQESRRGRESIALFERGRAKWSEPQFYESPTFERDGKTYVITQDFGREADPDRVAKVFSESIRATRPENKIG